MSERFRAEHTVDGPIVVDTMTDRTLFEGDLTELVDEMNQLHESLDSTRELCLELTGQRDEARESLKDAMQAAMDKFHIVFVRENGTSFVEDDDPYDVDLVDSYDLALAHIEDTFVEGPAFLQAWIVKDNIGSIGMGLSEKMGDLIYDQDRGDYDTWCKRFGLKLRD